MIINIRGTSGSGKSTIVRNIMASYDTRYPVVIKGRRQPLGYYCQDEGMGTRDMLAVVGHYETDCGGCDTIPDGHDRIYELVRQSRERVGNVLFEGLLLAAEYIRASELAKEFGDEFLIISLTTEIDECLASINHRRRENHKRRVKKLTKMNEEKAAKGNKLLPIPEYKGDVKPRNTIVKDKAMQNTLRRLTADGARIERHDRVSAEARIKELLGR